MARGIEVMAEGIEIDDRKTHRPVTIDDLMFDCYRRARNVEIGTLSPAQASAGARDYANIARLLETKIKHGPSIGLNIARTKRLPAKR